MAGLFDILVCPFCRGSLEQEGSTLTCPEGLCFEVLDGIPDLFLPRCRCGATLRPVRETSRILLSCPSCGCSVDVRDRMKEEQTESERKVYVARDKGPILEEWDDASENYWTIPLVALESERLKILRHVDGVLVLDMGTGPGLWLHYLHQVLPGDASVVACDISLPMLRRARSGIMEPGSVLSHLEFSIHLPSIADRHSFLDRILFVRADAERPPFPDDTFDTSISFQTLQYTNQRTSLAQLIRVTRPGGKVIIGTQPGGELSGSLEFDCDPEKIKDAKIRRGIQRRLESLHRFMGWLEERNPRQALLFREGWVSWPTDPFDLYYDWERGSITDEEFERRVEEWEREVSKPLDRTKFRCCYGEKRFEHMVRGVARDCGAEVIEVGTKIIPPEEAIKLDPDRVSSMDLEDAWSLGMYLHLFGARYAVLRKPG